MKCFLNVCLFLNRVVLFLCVRVGSSRFRICEQCSLDPLFFLFFFSVCLIDLAVGGESFLVRIV